jgi:CRISPR-associated protein Csd1
LVLQALNRYYHILTSDPQSGVPPVGYSKTAVSFAAVLSVQGELVDIVPLSETIHKGKKEWNVPLQLVVPAQVKRGRSIRANFLCDHCVYVLGLSERDEEDPSYAVYRFGAFRNKMFEVLSDAKSLEARAVLTFLEQYDPYAAREHSVIAQHVDELLKGGRLVFKLAGDSAYVHEHPEVRAKWGQYLADLSDANENVGQCLVTGETAPIARLHSSLKGIRGAAPTGASLVSFNARAYESYNHIEARGLNAPVSEQATFAYTTTLNWLLAKERRFHKIMIGPITVVYWAESTDPSYQVLLTGLLNPTENLLKGELQKEDLPAADRLCYLHEGDIEKMLEGLNPDMRVHVLGLLPNNSRLSVRFYHTGAFGLLAENIMTHYADVQIDKQFDTQPSQIPMWRLMDATISKVARNRSPSSLITGAFVNAIVNNTPYPATMYYALLNRIRADRDDAKKNMYKINYERVAMIKAYLIRKYRDQANNPFQGALTVILNEETVIPAYVLGRVFALLERVWNEATGGEALRHRYFSAVSASPARVFPMLLQKLNSYAKKCSPDGFIIQRKIWKILRLLGEETSAIPERFSLDEQGIFVLGYYHQRIGDYANRTNDF